ncbi:MAG: hypothetical protein ABSE70_01430 [Candidatus Limnocylindrales bacterium]
MNPLDLILWSLAGGGAIVVIGIAVAVALVALAMAVIVVRSAFGSESKRALNRDWASSPK